MGAFIVYIPTIRGVKIIGRENIISTYNAQQLSTGFQSLIALKTLNRIHANPLSAASLDEGPRIM